MHKNLEVTPSSLFSGGKENCAEEVDSKFPKYCFKPAINLWQKTVDVYLNIFQLFCRMKICPSQILPSRKCNGHLYQLHFLAERTVILVKITQLD